MEGKEPTAAEEVEGFAAAAITAEEEEASRNSWARRAHAFEGSHLSCFFSLRSSVLKEGLKGTGKKCAVLLFF